MPAGSWASEVTQKAMFCLSIVHAGCTDRIPDITLLLPSARFIVTARKRKNSRDEALGA